MKYLSASRQRRLIIPQEISHLTCVSLHRTSEETSSRLALIKSIGLPTHFTTRLHN